MIELKGIFPPLPTPFDSDEELLPDRIRENIRTLLKNDLAGVLLLGSNGELVMLSDKEKEIVFKSAREAIPSNKIMVAGTGGQSTREAVTLTKMAAASGADAALVINPFYYKNQMSKEALIAYYHTIADASSCPVIIYNMPGNTGIDMNAATILEISEHQNIIGVKDSGGNIAKLSEIVSNAKAGFSVIAGSAGFLLPALTVGAKGGILAMANIAPDICLDIFRLFKEGNITKASDLQGKIVALNTAVTAGGGVPALKAVMDHIGLYGGISRRPLMPITEAERKKVIDLYLTTRTKINS